MLKYILLASTMCIAAPALAQEMTPPDTQTQDLKPVTEPVPVAQEAPQPAEPAAPVAPADPAPVEAAAAQPAAPVPAVPVPATPAPPAPVAEAVVPAANAAPVAAAAPATPVPAAPATTQDEVAQVVTKEFASYDKDGNGALDQAEFAAWMVALRKASDPAFAAETPDGQAWLAAAFTQADADKNAGVSAVELTSFLTPKPAA